jgi:hypothetical protein
LLESVSGYRSDALRAEPIWATAARQGLEATALAATQSVPFEPYLGERRFGADFGARLTLLDGYQAPGLAEVVHDQTTLHVRPASGWDGDPPPGAGEVELRVGEAPVFGLLYDDPADTTSGFDTLLLAHEKDASSGVRLKPRAAPAGAAAWVTLATPFRGGVLAVPYRLFELEPDGSRILLYQAQANGLLASRAGAAEAAARQAGVFVGNGAYRAYREGRLGPTLARGGDGTAERRYLETAEWTIDRFSSLTRFALGRAHWRLFVGYLPYPDEALHEWLGLLDGRRPGYDPALAARLQPGLDRLLAAVDSHVGELAAAAGDGVVFAVVSDHGLVPVWRRLHLNLVLERHGWLARQDATRIALARTHILLPPWNPAFLLLNRETRPDGRVSPRQEAALVARVAAALRSLRDPESGEPLVKAVFTASSAPRSLSGLAGGDLYFSLAEGLFPSAELDDAVVSRTAPRGEHLLDPDRPEMHAVFVLAGPGVAPGVDLGIAGAVDVAPTLSALLGIDPPAQASGRVLEHALARTVHEVRSRRPHE